MSDPKAVLPADRVDAGWKDGWFPEDASFSEMVRLYIEIARPRVMALVVFTGLPALLMGQDTWPSVGQAGWVLAGTGMAGAASSAFNAYIERDADARMSRTRRRALPAAVLLPRAVIGYAWFLTFASTAVLYAVGGAVAAMVSLSTIAFYVIAYTMWLKPRTPQNIVIGGAAGGTAPLIASAAMDGGISLGAWLMFLIIFLWTPPHFWAIALVRREEYEAAGFPMMPSVIGDRATRRLSLAYALALLPVTLAPWWLCNLSVYYAAAAVALGAWFLGSILISMRDENAVADWRVFKVSVSYLSFLFLMMLLDMVVLWQ
jgi:protoheme IX farnesyltransferase